MSTPSYSAILYPGMLPCRDFSCIHFNPDVHSPDFQTALAGCYSDIGTLHTYGEWIILYNLALSKVGQLPDGPCHV